MTRTRPKSIPIPLRSILPPSTSEELEPSSHLPSPSIALLGPLPPTSVFHLALNYLALSDRQEKENAAETASVQRRRVMVITGPKDEMRTWMEEDDEAWMREHGGEYGVLDRLKRVDMRYCPTIAHLTILLTLLSSDPQSLGKDAHALRQIPSVIILWDIAKLLMEEVAVDENLPPGLDEEPPKKGAMRFKSGVVLSDYTQLIAAARHTVQHLSSLDQSLPPLQLIILEPHFDRLSSLPILSTLQADQPELKLATPTRKKRISIIDGLAWMFGPDAVGLIAEDEMELDDEGETSRYTLKLPYREGDSYGMRRKRCGRAQLASDGMMGGGMTEGDTSGWQWEWSM